jgi:DNA-binding CsgD family transcriptional regulator
MKNLNAQLGVCIKKLDREVISQNEMCQQTCGDMVGKICEKGCMTHYSPSQSSQEAPQNNLNEGMTLAKNSIVDKNLVDAVVINDGKTLTTILYSLEEKMKSIDQNQEQLKNFGLTKSEITIFTMVMQGSKNFQICKALFISKATLKTHLNNIYKKLPPSWHHYKKRL